MASQISFPIDLSGPSAAAAIQVAYRLSLRALAIEKLTPSEMAWSVGQIARGILLGMVSDPPLASPTDPKGATGTAAVVASQ
jgi:hypothetical protein